MGLRQHGDAECAKACRCGRVGRPPPCRLGMASMTRIFQSPRYSNTVVSGTGHACAAALEPAPVNRSSRARRHRLNARDSSAGSRLLERGDIRLHERTCPRVGRFPITPTGPVSSCRIRLARACRIRTAGTVVSRIAAASAAEKAMTSRSSSTARSCGGRCCRAAITASRIDSFDTTARSGSSDGCATRAPGIGWTHATSTAGICGESGSGDGGPSPEGSTRRRCCG